MPKRKRKKQERLARLDLMVDPGLKGWIKSYAEKNCVTVTALVTTYFLNLKAQESVPDVESI